MVSVPVLSLHSTSTPASSSIADSRETIAFCRDRARAPSAMVTDITAGIATGTEAISSTSTNWAMPPERRQPQASATTHVAVDLEADQERRQGCREQDQEVADLQHRLPRRATWSRPRRPASRSGRRTCCCRSRSRPRSSRPAWRCCPSRRRRPPAWRPGSDLARQRCLVDAEIGAVDQQELGRDDLASGHGDDVARHELGRVDREPLLAAQRRALSARPFSRAASALAALLSCQKPTAAL